MKIWFKLDGESADRVEVQDGAIVVDLRDAIKGKCPNTLSDLDPLQLKVFAAGVDPNDSNVEALDPGDPVPDGTTAKTPLIVTLGDVAAAHPPPSKQPRRAVFRVSVIVKGALRSNGARGNVFRLLEIHKGFYSEKEGIQVAYQEDDLHAKAYFKTEDNALEFQTAMNQWEIHKELVNLDGVEIKRKTPQEVPAPGDLQHFILQDYKPEDSESPCHSLNQLHSYRLSVPATEVAEPSEPTTKYQSLDVPISRINPFLSFER